MFNIKYNYSLSVIVLFSLFSFILTASTLTTSKTKETFSLKSAISYGIDHNIEIKELQEKLHEINGKATKARSSIYPELYIQSVYSRYRDPSVLNRPTLDSPSEIEIDPDNNYDISLKLIQPIWMGGAVFNVCSIISLEKKIQEESLRHRKILITHKIVKEYYHYLLSLEQLNVLNKSMIREKNNLKIIISKRRVGVATNFEVLRAKVFLSRLEMQTLEAMANIDRSRMTFNRIIGRGVGLPVILSDKLEIEIKKLLSLEEALEIASKNRSELIQLKYSRSILDKSRNIEYAKHKPSFLLQGSYGYNTARKNDLFDSYFEKYNVSLIVKIPLFNGFSLLGSVKEIASKKKQLELKKYKIKENIFMQVKSSIDDLYKAESTIKTSHLMTRQAKEALDLAISGFANGTTTSYDVLTSQRDRSNAELEYNMAKFKYVMAVSKFKETLGSSYL